MPAVSIIVPNYNHEKYLRKRLDSIFGQTFRDFEVILLDDASTDGSGKLLEEYAERPEVSELIINRENSGSAFQQWKKGLRFAVGDFVWIAESDDFSDERFLAAMMDFFRQEPNVDLVFCGSWYVDEKDQVVKEAPGRNESFMISGPGIVQKYFAKYNIIMNASSCVFKRKLVDPEYFEFAYFQYCGDWMFWSDLACRTWKVAYLNDRMNYFRVHENNVSSGAERNGLYFREGFQVLDAIRKKQKFTPASEYQVFKYWGLKLHEAVFQKKIILPRIKILVLLQSFIFHIRIFRWAVWNHRVKIGIRKLLWKR